MKANLNYKNITREFSFNIEHEGFTYVAKVYLDGEKDKFIDEVITLNDEPLGGEGEQGEIREAIIDYLDANWEKLV
jgi:hypothetical protein